ncbi:prokaryotic phospholipase A2-domain-containing protein [Ampelomyces quisqualis]|uniref:Prokaryotic phospholipase A2-domain-containing protein n=1 Tax=Ampelomyces quisqualis TaxID=50730 RepID=A0A6A5QY53_AMPQU|nr:prokaryotic phospholipase A2-domain-containing protein [Ampelomyces quisqualis]
MYRNMYYKITRNMAQVSVDGSSKVQTSYQSRKCNAAVKSVAAFYKNMHFPTIAFLSLATGTLAAVTPSVAAMKNTDYYIFNMTLPEFLAVAAVKEGEDLGLDWSNNGCSSAPETPFDFDFHNSCVRHDFAYHNYILQKRCGAIFKKMIDKNFRKDMLNECAKEETEIRREACENVANVYYASVRVFGKSHFC